MPRATKWKFKTRFEMDRLIRVRVQRTQFSPRLYISFCWNISARHGDREREKERKRGRERKTEVVRFPYYFRNGFMCPRFLRLSHWYGATLYTLRKFETHTSVRCWVALIADLGIRFCCHWERSGPLKRIWIWYLSPWHWRFQLFGLTRDFIADSHLFFTVFFFLCHSFDGLRRIRRRMKRKC